MPDFNNFNENEHLSLDEIEAQEQAEKKAQKSKFNIFNRAYQDGKGVEKDELTIAQNPTFLNFFKLVGRKINPMLSLNLMYILGNFPIFFFLLYLTGYFSIHTTSPYYAAYAPLRGAMLFHNSPAVSAVWTLYSRQAEVTVHTTVDKVLLGLTALLIITYGPVRVGITYIMRKMFCGEPIFMMYYFFYAIKRDWKRAILLSVLDLGVNAILIYDLVFFYINYNVSMLMSIMFFLSIGMMLLYFFMRPYLYLILVTFTISVPKMYKNAIYFTVLGLKRNLMYLLGTIATFAFEYLLLSVYFPLGVIVPFILMPSFLMMMGVYAAYPKIKQFMIDPFYET